MKNPGNPQDSQVASESGFRNIDGTPPRFSCASPGVQRPALVRTQVLGIWLLILGSCRAPALPRFPASHICKLCSSRPPFKEPLEWLGGVKPDNLLDPRDTHGGRREPSPDSCPLTSTFIHCGTHKPLLQSFG